MANDFVIRRNYLSLSQDEKSHFLKAIRKMQNTKINSSKYSVYEKYVIWHINAMNKLVEGFPRMNQAHDGPVFLPWHREFLRRFEKDLQIAAEDSTLGLSYWKWEDEEDPNSSRLWDEQLMGGNGNRNYDHPSIPVRLSEGVGFAVTTGEFKYDPDDPLTYKILIFDQNGKPYLDENEDPIRMPLVRWFFINGYFPKKEMVEVYKIDIYDSTDWNRHMNDENPSFRNTLEGWKGLSNWEPLDAYLHNNIHVWERGSMRRGESPSDPVFFLNHSNVDRIWAKWQSKRNETNWYPAENDIQINGNIITGHNRLDRMFPWNNDSDNRPTVESMLNHHNLNYRYDDE
jgi:tyrosinase